MERYRCAIHQTLFGRSESIWLARRPETITRAITCQGSGGAFFFAAFILAAHRPCCHHCPRTEGDAWWRFVLYGLVVAIVPGAISTWPFHEMRLMAYPVFLLLLTVPALEWLLARAKQARIWCRMPSGESGESSPGGGARRVRDPEGCFAAGDSPVDFMCVIGAHGRGSLPLSDCLSP